MVPGGRQRRWALPSGSPAHVDSVEMSPKSPASSASAALIAAYTSYVGCSGGATGAKLAAAASLRGSGAGGGQQAARWRQERHSAAGREEAQPDTCMLYNAYWHAYEQDGAS